MGHHRPSRFAVPSTKRQLQRTQSPCRFCIPRRYNLYRYSSRTCDRRGCMIVHFNHCRNSGSIYSKTTHALRRSLNPEGAGKPDRSRNRNVSGLEGTKKPFSMPRVPPMQHDRMCTKLDSDITGNNRLLIGDAQNETRPPPTMEKEQAFKGNHER